ncbi:hypothetical protein [Natronorarus salvus]|uniref:hypothetical protein n=1 Tax=Natronorarus salvus TaxID=3117733 RepID=UPI002F26CF22
MPSIGCEDDSSGSDRGRDPPENDGDVGDEPDCAYTEYGTEGDWSAPNVGLPPTDRPSCRERSDGRAEDRRRVAVGSDLEYVVGVRRATDERPPEEPDDRECRRQSKRR